MVAPPRLTSIQLGQVYKLKKISYGLKQAKREWFVKELSFLLSMGYTQSTNDHSLFILLKDLLQHYWCMWMI